VHASLLPRWRGAAPIQRALLAGDTQTGVCLMQMEAGLDTGPVLLQHSLAITAEDTGGSLHDRLAAAGAKILAEGLRRIVHGPRMEPMQQPADGVTYAHKLEKAEAGMNWNESALALERKVRAFNPWPVAEAAIGGERLRIWAAHALQADTSASPGSIIASGRDGIDVACAHGILRITEVQRAGGARMPARAWLNAHPLPGNVAL
jgi:methionyl-tRNA formyltransferase